MTEILLRVDDVLRRQRSARQAAQHWSSLTNFTVLTILFGMLYGAVMGTFGGFAVERLWQLVYSAVKVPLLLMATFVISLPSFYVFNALLGLRRDFGDVVRALVATQAGLAIILASLAPLTALWYVSSADYQLAILFNALIFAIASLAAQWLLRGYYRPLIFRNRRHRWLLWSWILVYALNGIQMGWVLRPFVGSPDGPVQFFRSEAWDNAYVVVGRLIWQAMTR